MARLQQIQTISFFAWIRSCVKSLHGWLILLGLSAGLWYFPAWMAGLIDRGPQDSDGFTLVTCFVGLSFYFLWRERKQLALLEASEEDRLLGYVLIVCGTVLFPFCRFAIWPQALLWLIILAGIACCSWGIQFFGLHKLLLVSALVTVYPQPGVTARLLWQAVTPYKFLEQIMAQAGAGALKLFGWQASAVESFVTFPEGAVDVAWGCNGFDMALTMVVAGLIMGLFLKQSRLRILGFIVIGVVASFIFNVPRVMLLAIASVYWGHGAFEFWHGPWGGQLFSGILFMVYYYLVMWLANRQSQSKSQTI
jgi:exosortase